MELSKHKNKYLGLATSLTAPAIVMLTKGRYYEGSILMAIAVGLIGIYAYYDDKQKGAPALPEGVDEELLRRAAEVGADRLEEVTDVTSSHSEDVATETSQSEVTDARRSSTEETSSQSSDGD